MRFKKLESMRGFAAIYVVLHHLVPSNYSLLNINLGFIFRFGQEAVILFFLLSGFVVNYSYQQSKNADARIYFFKRFNRIYIPLICVFVVSYFLVCIEEQALVAPLLNQLFLNLLMLQDIPELKPNVLIPPYLGNSPLWSLSYEWWFYMLYYPLQKIRNKHLSFLVFVTSITAAFVYIFYPNFLTRLLMYFGIWWSGVFLSNLFLANKDINFCSTFPVLVPLAILTTICVAAATINSLTNHAFSFGVHPWLEVRHFSFAFICIITAILWRRIKWVGFNSTLGLFKSFAPISYVIYIAHYPLLIKANYLSFIENQALELLFYSIILFSFAWVVELKISPKINAKIFSFISPKYASNDDRMR